MAEDSDSFPNFPPFELPKGIKSSLRAWDLKAKAFLNADPMTTKNKMIRCLPSRGKKARSDDFRVRASAGSTGWIGRRSSYERGLVYTGEMYTGETFCRLTFWKWPWREDFSDGLKALKHFTKDCAVSASPLRPVVS